MRNRFFIITVSGIVIFILAVIMVIFLLTRKEKSEDAKLSSPLSSFQQEIQKTEESIKVIIFFPSENDEFLHPEERKILKTSSLSNQVKQVLLEIIKGSERRNLTPIPEGTKIREVYIHKDGTAYLDLSSDFIKGNYGGSSYEIEAIYSIVNSITFNFPSIKRVHFLFDGMERETLKGHICVNKSFLPNYSLIKSK
ncbi:MAG: GerMN domain-containing protein [Candidatus Aminicenantia bacterium]